MPCKNALIKDPVTIDGDLNVNDAINIATEHELRNLPVLSDDGDLLGMFGTHAVLNSLLPVSARVEGGGLDDLAFTKGETADLAMNLEKIGSENVRNHMTTNLVTVTPETPLWEVIRIIVRHGSPIVALDLETKKFVGLVTEQSVLAHLENLKNTLEM